MSNSLRDQLLQAGFTDNSPKPAKRNKPKTQTKTKRANSPASGQQAAAAKAAKAAQVEADNAKEIAKRKQIKAAIKTLIETDGVKDFAGEIHHHYLAGSRIRTLYVSQPIRDRLIAEELVITRLNGSTWLVPTAVANNVLALNPDWAIFKASATASSDVNKNSEDDSRYAEFPVPDDLNW